MPLGRKQIFPHLKPTLPKMVQEIWRETTQAEFFVFGNTKPGSFSAFADSQ